MTEVIVWSGWAGGLAVGLYAMFQLLITGRPLGISSGYCILCGCFSRALFFRLVREKDGPVNWRFWFMLGLPLGGIVAAVTSPGGIAPSFSLGAFYDAVFPDALWLKALVLIAGGFLMGVGARLAGGCTSGHTISGVAMLNPPSILASIGFFVGGTIMVQLLFHVFFG